MDHKQGHSYLPISNNYQNAYYNAPLNNDNDNTNFQQVPISDDLEANQGIKFDYQQQMRLGFIKKVYGVLSTQLLVTFLICLISMSFPAFAKFQIQNPAIIYFTMFVNIIVCIALMCFPKMLKTVPTNYILLSVFTLCEAYLVSTICSLSSPRIVLMAASMTLGITIMLTYYACTTKDDFTVCGSLMFILIGILLMFSIFTMFTQNKTIHVIYCCLGVLVYSLYLVYDTQLLLGTKQNSLDYDDYIIGALMLYVDIISIFLDLLQLLNSSQNN